MSKNPSPEERKDRRQRFRERHPDASIGYHRRWRYGVSPEEYDALLVSQKGVCGICLQPETTRRPDGRPRPLSIDHDHLTGQIRGLLCHSCNVAIGHFDDSLERLEAAARYLKSVKPLRLVSGD